MAEREGFEPSEGDYPFSGLANRRLRPLSHLSFGALFSNNNINMPHFAHFASEYLKKTLIFLCLWLVRTAGCFNPRGLKASRADWGLAPGTSFSFGESEDAHGKTGEGELNRLFFSTP